MPADIVIREGSAVQQGDKPSMLQAVMAAAMNPDLDPERIERFLNMARELERDQKQQEFNVAFKAAYDVISKIRIAKNGEIHYPGKGGGAGSKVTFIKHDDLSRAIKPVLSDNGLVATYSAKFVPVPPKTIMVMKIRHTNGISEEFESIALPVIDSSGGKNDVQGAGSVSTYGRRYVIIPAFDIVAEGADDYGNLGRAAQPISEEQALMIEDILSALEEHTKGKRKAFLKWIGEQFKAQKVSDLRQGAQLDEVMAKLDLAQRQAGLKR